MVNTIIDLFNNILKYDGKEIRVIIDDVGLPWFNGSNVANILEYENGPDALKKHVKDKNKKILKDLVKDYKNLYPNAQPYSVYIKESGLYSLLKSSHMEKADKFRDWIYEEVLPSLIHTGVYKLSEKQMKEQQKIMFKLNKFKTENKVLSRKVEILENNMRKEKYPNGGVVYIYQTVDKKDTNMHKIGKSDKVHGRIRSSNTTVADNVEVLYILKVDNPVGVETCLKGVLHQYRYRNKKDYYKCELETIKDVIVKCNNLIKSVTCNKCKKNIKTHNLSRHDEQHEHIKPNYFGIMVEYNENQKGGHCSNNSDYDDVNNDNNNESDNESNNDNDDNDDNIKNDGYFEYKYLKYRCKYFMMNQTYIMNSKNQIL